MTEKRDYPAEIEKIKEFLTTFYVNDGPKNHYKYATQLDLIARRDQISLQIDLDDVHSFDPSLCEKLRINCRRYVNLFSQAIDDLLPTYLDAKKAPAKDALDAFIYQRLVNEERAQRDRGDEIRDARKAYPPELMRRLDYAVGNDNWLAF